MARALRAGLRNGGLRRGGLRPGLGEGNLFSIASLDLNFAAYKNLGSLVTFTRASSGTFVGSDGVLQTAVTNLLLRSEEFDNATWSKTRSSVTANATTSPAGTLTADKLVEDTTASNSHQLVVSPSTASGIYTCSIYAKAAERTQAAIRLDIGTLELTIFNLSAGTVISTTSGITSSITPVGDGWYRLTATLVSAASVINSIFQTATGGTNVYTGDGTSGIFLWGAQLEQSAAVGEYIPTTSAINSAPRFDHNPTTGESLGLLVEEARTNLVLRSEAIATSPWFNANVTLTNNTSDVLDPAGGSTATKVVATGSSSAFGQPITLTAAIYAGSIWLRCATGTVSAQLIVYLGGSPFTNIGTTNVTITTSWQRFSVVTSTATAASYNLQLNAIAAGTVYAWGAQLEAGAFPTSYIPTTSATVARAADVASITGTNFSSWYNQTEGTVYHQGRTPTTANFFSIDDGTVNNRITSYMASATAPYLFVSTGGAVIANLTSSAITTGSLFAQANAYKAADFAISTNGGTVSTASSGAVPVVNKMVIGANVGGGAAVNGTIKRLTYFPTRLANTNLQAITQ